MYWNSVRVDDYFIFLQLLSIYLFSRKIVVLKFFQILSRLTSFWLSDGILIVAR